ncbi:MAG TPA: hypothetical protein VME86_15845 [Acidobacteriaceae bacterium]|nr:hypothetical protein [Acidobacteriaceae bacterium]
MSGFIAPLFMTLAVFALYMVLAWMLLRKYKRTGDTGFLWLGAAVILWPFLSSLLVSAGHYMVQHFMNGHVARAHVKRVHGAIEVNALPAILASFQRLIEIGLLLVSVHFLAKNRESSAPTVSPLAAEQPSVEKMS